MKPIFISCSYEHKSAGLGWIAGKPNFPLRLIDHGLAWHDMWRKFDHFPRFSTLAFSVIVIFHNSRTVSIFFPSLPALPYSKISLFLLRNSAEHKFFHRKSPNVIMNGLLCWIKALLWAFVDCVNSNSSLWIYCSAPCLSNKTAA